jgi:PhoPQ-activated pathogenicity-related protein
LHGKAVCHVVNQEGLTKENITMHALRTAAFLPLLLFSRTALHAGGLEDYVRQPDGSFKWTALHEENMQGLAVARLEMVSQTWRGGRWTHDLYVGCPSTVRNPSVAFLEITGGAGAGTLQAAKALAERSGALVAVLSNVPNQPLFGGKREDQIIAYTFDQYLKTGDETWPLLLPMVKSAVRAMDAVQSWALSARQQKVEKFVVSGASKRGWTTWLTAAVDPRVCGIAPMVFDMLNMKAQTDAAQKAYGRQSEQIHDYTDLGIVGKIDTPEMVKLRAVVDPYAYRARFTMPKLLLFGTNDRYWTVDALRHYWPDLPEPKLVYQAPNTGHGAGGAPEAIQTLAAFFQMIADRQELPRMEWQMAGGAKPFVVVKADRPAKQAVLWCASSPTRDFRDAKWTSRVLPLGTGAAQVSADVEKPANGYSAFMVELTFTAAAGPDYRLSTQVQVTPDN